MDFVHYNVLITGAGPIGIIAAAVAHHVGARHVAITDINPARLELASKVSDFVPVDVTKENLQDVITKLGIKQGFDVGLDVSKVITHRFPADQFQDGFDAMLSGTSGKVVLDWTT